MCNGKKFFNKDIIISPYHSDRHSKMKTPEPTAKQHIMYCLILLLVVSSLVYVGYHQVTSLKQDYHSQITSLRQDLDTVQNALLLELDAKQQQIDALDASLQNLDADLKTLDKNVIDISDELNLQIRQLSETSEQFGSQLQQLEYTTGLYEVQIGKLDQQLSDLVVESESFSTVIPWVIDSVVSIAADTGQGSGAIISSEGLVVTNYHVIQGATRASVMTYDGNTHRIGLIGYNIKNDLAVLKIISNETFHYFKFGDSDTLKTGQKVVALGNPAGLSFTATEGIISSPSRVASDGLSYIQTDVSLNVGNSGGPLINSKGELIGIVDFKVSGYEGLGFAIPGNRAKGVIEGIIDY